MHRARLHRRDRKAGTGHQQRGTRSEACPCRYGACARARASGVIHGLKPPCMEVIVTRRHRRTDLSGTGPARRFRQRQVRRPPGEREVPSRPHEPPPRSPSGRHRFDRASGGNVRIPGLGAGRRGVTPEELARGGCASGAFGRAGPGWGDLNLSRKHYASARLSGRDIRAWGCPSAPAVDGRVACLYICRRGESVARDCEFT